MNREAIEALQARAQKAIDDGGSTSITGHELMDLCKLALPHSYTVKPEVNARFYDRVRKVHIACDALCRLDDETPIVMNAWEVQILSHMAMRETEKRAGYTRWNPLSWPDHAPRVQHAAMMLPGPRPFTIDAMIEAMEKDGLRLQPAGTAAP